VNPLLNPSLAWSRFRDFSRTGPFAGAFAVLTLELFWPQKDGKSRIQYLALPAWPWLFGFSAWVGEGGRTFPRFLISDGLASVSKGIVLLICFLTVVLAA